MTGSLSGDQRRIVGVRRKSGNPERWLVHPQSSITRRREEREKKAV
jgi:hypothetical protein